MCSTQKQNEYDMENENLGMEIYRGKGAESENETLEASFGKDLPSVEDVCSICFDRFTIPCRTNCGHWYCATCILQFWMFRSSIQPCKCPLCCCPIVKLEPRLSRTMPQSDENFAVLKKVHQYNGLYTGVFGTIHKIQAFPLFMGRIFRVLIDPDFLRCIHYGTRIIGLCLGLLYERWEFEFMPTGGMGIQRMFNLGGSLLVAVLFCIGMVYRWLLRRRARRLATLQVWDG